MADKEEDVDLGEEGEGKGSKKKLIIFGGIGLLVLMLGGGGAAFFLMGSDDEMLAEGEEAVEEIVEELPKIAIYHALEPSFVVNFQGKGKHRFLQLDLQVMARNEEAIAAVEQHAPMIRNNLLMLFGTVDSSELTTREGKEKLRADVLAELQEVLSKEIGEPGVEDVFFTSFVMQ